MVKGEFTYVPQWKSGLNIRGNVRSLKMFPVGKGSGNQFIFGINNAPVKTVKN
jgi:hypothetical protein